MKSEKFSGAVSDGEPVYAKDGLMYFACCDCGLTHMIVITVIDKIDVELRFFRDGRRSYHRRKAKKYKFIETKRKN